MKEIVRKIHMSGEGATELLKIKSFLSSHSDHARHPKIKAKFAFSLLFPSTSLQLNSSKLLGVVAQPKTSLKRLQPNLAGAHSTKGNIPFLRTTNKKYF
jgi:hypothetical protein